jgi:hypothetical protein
MSEDGKELGLAQTRLARGLLHILPVARAFSYLVRQGEVPPVALTCEREQVVPGETLTVVGKIPHSFRVPPNTAASTHLWQQFEGTWIDFRVVPLVDASLRLDGALRLDLKAHLPSSAKAHVTLGDVSQQLTLMPAQVVSVQFPIRQPAVEEVRPLRLGVTTGPFNYERTWWLKAEERIVPLAAFSDSVQSGQRLRKGPETPLDDASGAIVNWQTTACGAVEKRCLFMHPPYKSGVGYAFALSEPIDLPANPPAAFRCEIGKADGSDPGDGVLFRVAVHGPDGKETIVAEKTWIEHAWTRFHADLSAFAGKRVRIKLIADVGPADNSAGDWACWAGMRIDSLRPALDVTLHEERVDLERRQGPFPVAGLTPQQLRQATSAVLHFQGIGLENGAKYVSHASLNGVRLGPLPAAGGDEQKNTWADASLPIRAEAVAALDPWNRLVIDNPAGDCFKVRGFWIELLLSDGRKCSSQITSTTYTQPPDWAHAEGTRIPLGKPVEITIRFVTK